METGFKARIGVAVVCAGGIQNLVLLLHRCEAGCGREAVGGLASLPHDPWSKCWVLVGWASQECNSGSSEPSSLLQKGLVENS